MTRARTESPQVSVARGPKLARFPIMLANLLPGLRDIRAPLAAGYVWLVVGYIAFDPLVPSKPHGIWETLSHLDHLASAVGLGVAVSFLAYVIGTLSQAPAGVVAGLLGRWASDRYGQGRTNPTRPWTRA